MTSRQIMMDAFVVATADKVECKYLVSRSTRDCRLRKNSAAIHRVSARVGITGGYVSGASDTNFVKSETRRERRTREYFASKVNR